MLDATLVPTMNSAELEAAFDSTVGKMKVFFDGLPSDEKAVFFEMLKAASEHTNDVQAGNEGEAEKTIYNKPVQVHKTSNMKATMQRLPELFQY